MDRHTSCGKTLYEEKRTHAGLGIQKVKRKRVEKNARPLPFQLFIPAHPRLGMHGELFYRQQSLLSRVSISALDLSTLWSEKSSKRAYCEEGQCRRTWKTVTILSLAERNSRKSSKVFQNSWRHRRRREYIDGRIQLSFFNPYWIHRGKDRWRANIF